MTALNFTASGDEFISQAFEVEGDISIEVLADKNFKVGVDESIAGEVWSNIDEDRFYPSKFHMNIVGLVAGQKIRVRTSVLPISASYV